MSFKAKLFIENEERNILDASLIYKQFADANGRPTGRPFGSPLKFSLESTSNDSLFYEYMFSPTSQCRGEIVFYKRDGLSTLFKIEFANAHIVGLTESFSASGNDPLNFEITIGWGIIKVRGVVFEEAWNPNNPFEDQVSPTVINENDEPLITNIEWIDCDTGDKIEETAYGEIIGLVAHIENPQGNSASIIIEKSDGTEFENGKTQLTFDEAISEDGKMVLSSIEIKEQWLEFKEADTDNLLAKVTHYGCSRSSRLLTITPPLKKFLVHFRRPENYDGTYGFDWLRDEYVYPIETVAYDNDGTTVIGRPIALCMDPETIRNDYRQTDVVNGITPYGLDYYPAWLSIFPDNASEQLGEDFNLHENGVTLDLEIEELEALTPDGTDISFVSDNPNLVITPNTINLSSLISNKQTKNLGETIVRDYYLIQNAVNIKCHNAPIDEHTEIKVLAVLGNTTEEIGKLMVYKNNEIPRAEIVVVNFITDGTAPNFRIRDDYKEIYEQHSLNQALIRPEVMAFSDFNINDLPDSDPDVVSFKANYHVDPEIPVSIAGQFIDDLTTMYERYGSHPPTNGGINSGSNPRTYIFYTAITCPGAHGVCSAELNSSHVVTQYGNSYVVFGFGVSLKFVLLHELGHSFSLPHLFRAGLDGSRHVFYKGYTDNIMDYVTRIQDPTHNTFYENDKMNNFFKWQWDIMRSDRSLIY